MEEMLGRVSGCTLSVKAEWGSRVLLEEAYWHVGMEKVQEQ